MKKSIKSIAIVIAMTISVMGMCVPVNAETRKSQSKEIMRITHQEHMFGDVNYDYHINLDDVVILQKYIANLVDYNSICKELSLTTKMCLVPVSNEKEISMIDVTLMQQYIAKLISDFPVEKNYPESWSDYSWQSGDIIDNYGLNLVRSQDFYDLPEITVDSDEYSKAFDVCVDLFQKGVSKDENTLISPMSILIALASTANGADGETLEQMKRYLGNYDSLDQLNMIIKALQERFNSENPDYDLSVLNSIWVKDDPELFEVKEDFINSSDKYFNAEVYYEDFSDTETVNKINKWVEDNTYGLIKKLIEKIKKEDAIFLINTIAFCADWDSELDIARSQPFYGYNDNVNSDAEYVKDDECKSYIYDDNSEGFIKKYKGGDYSFVAILPDSEIDILEYAQSFDGEKLRGLIKSETSKYNVRFTMPMLKYDFSVNYNDLLKKEFPAAFDVDSADFSKMLYLKKPEYNAFIGDILHKTAIELDEKGTTAVAATSVSIDIDYCAQSTFPDKIICLNRPYVYAIIENTTKLPLFMGVVLNID